MSSANAVVPTYRVPTAFLTPQSGFRDASAKVGLRELVACFCTKRRDKRRVFGWEVMDWEGVTNFKKSAENDFGRILLPKEMGHDGSTA